MVQLYDWQKPSRDKIVGIFRAGGMAALDTSETGTGKTFVAVDSIRELNRKALVVCPKAVISSWRSVIKLFGIEHLVLDVINSEKLQKNRSPWFKDNAWQTPSGTMLVLDEVHKGCAGVDTATSKIVALTKAYKLPVLAMSATPADSPLKLRALGYLLDLHRFNKPSFYDFCARNGCYRNPWGAYEFTKGPKGQQHMAAIFERIKDKMTRIRIDEAPGFPECDTQAELVDLSDEERDAINEAYADMMNRLMQPNSNPMVELLRARQIAELQKVNVMEELVTDCLEEEHSAVVFVNFRETMSALYGQLTDKGHKVSLIHGVQGEREQWERDEHIARFQRNETHVMIAMSQAGGVGVSLHDLHGRPRRSFITPSYNASECKQVLGRIHRAGAKSKAIQKFILAAGTVEEDVYLAIQRKLRCIDALTDGDLDITKGRIG